MGIVANMPLALAPAMGVNAYFTYTIVGFMGTGLISYQYALAAAFVEGWLFILISITGVRGKLVELIPKNIMYATACGIGAFLAFIGLQQGEGLALITYGATLQLPPHFARTILIPIHFFTPDGATLVTLGGCPPEERAHMYEMRDIDAYWMNWCWSAWRSSDTAPSNLTGSTDAIAAAFFASMNVSLPINKVDACSNVVFPSIPYPTQALSPVPDVFFGLPPRSANYGCLGKVSM